MESSLGLPISMGGSGVIFSSHNGKRLRAVGGVLTGKKAIAVLLVLVLSTAFIFAEGFTFTASAEPAVQKVIYDNPSYPDRTTNGVLVGASCLYNLEGGNAFGLELTVGTFPYSGFYSYTDFRASMAMRWRILDVLEEDDTFKAGVFMAFNVGVSMDLRNDSDIGLYPMFILAPGVVVGTDSFSVEIYANLSMSYQNGSSVMQLSPKVGVSIPVGGNAR